MNKKTCAYIVLGTLGALFVGAFTYLNISIHGLVYGLLWTVGTFAFGILLNKLIFTSIDWLVEAQHEERMKELAKLEAQVEAECDKDFEEFKKQMDEARDLAKTGKLAGLEIGIVDGKIKVTHLTSKDVKEKLAKGKKPVKKVVKTDKLHTVKKGRVVAR